jgi:hypothetical protein
MTAKMSGTTQAPVQSLLNLSPKFYDALIVEGQKLRKHGAGNTLDRINPVVAVEETRPTAAACAASVGAGLRISDYCCRLRWIAS